MMSHSLFWIKRNFLRNNYCVQYYFQYIFVMHMPLSYFLDGLIVIVQAIYLIILYLWGLLSSFKEQFKICLFLGSCGFCSDSYYSFNCGYNYKSNSRYNYNYDYNIRIPHVIRLHLKFPTTPTRVVIRRLAVFRVISATLKTDHLILFHKTFLLIHPWYTFIYSWL